MSKVSPELHGEFPGFGLMMRWVMPWRCEIMTQVVLSGFSYTLIVEPFVWMDVLTRIHSSKCYSTPFTSHIKYKVTEFVTVTDRGRAFCTWHY